MKKSFFLLFTMLGIQFCTNELSETDNVSEENKDSNSNLSYKNPSEQIDSIATDPVDNITIDPMVVELSCTTNGGKAGDTGLKTWCWADVPIPLSGKVSDGDLYIDSESQEKQITNEGNRIRFDLQNTNKRAEIRTAPWPIRHPEGTEEWFGFNYTFGQDYIIDQNSEWAFFQVHNGVVGTSPQIGLFLVRQDQYGGDAGELFMGNNPAGSPVSLGIIPQAGDELNIVVHVIWAGPSTGLLQIWINDVSVYDKQVATIYPGSPWGGNAKWGIYKWPWEYPDRVQESIDQGITHVETFMGPLRIITRKLGDMDYGKDSYELVKSW